MRRLIGVLALALITHLTVAIPMGIAAYHTPTNWIHRGVTVGWINFWVVQGMVAGILLGAGILIVAFSLIIYWMSDK